MIAKDEERNIERAIRSVKQIVDEIIVVDTGSKDATIEIARSLGALVTAEPWEDDFSKARNASLRGATAVWILVLDADETISERDLDKVKSMIHDAGERVGGFMFRMRNYLDTPTSERFFFSKDDPYPESSCCKGWHEAGMVRLFRNKKEVRYEGRVHESVKSSLLREGLEIVQVDIPIHHFGKLSSKAVEKGRVYEALGERKVSEKGDFKSYFELGVQKLVNGKYDDAIGYLEEARGKNPGHQRTYLNLGAAYLKAGRLTDAERIFREGLQIREQEDLYNNLGAALEAQGKAGLAFEAYRKSAYLKENEEAYQNIARICVTLGKVDDAIRVLQRVIALDPGNLINIHNLAGLLLHKGDAAQAVIVLLPSITQKENTSKSDAVTYELLAWGYLALGDRAKSRSCLERAIELGHPKKAELLRELRNFDEG